MGQAVLQGKLVFQFLSSKGEKHNFQRGPGVHRTYEHTVGTCRWGGTVPRVWSTAGWWAGV